MKRFNFLVAILGIILLSQPALANFGDKQYFAEVHDERSQTPHAVDGRIQDATVMVFVYDAGTKTLSTIYSDKLRTSKANPITRSQYDTDNGIKFWSGKSSHDIFIAHSDGSVARVSGATPNTKRVVLNRAGIDKVVIFPMAFDAAGAEVNTGIDLPKNSLVYDVGLEVVATDSGETAAIGLLSSGTGGDADGLMLATTTANSGYLASYAVTDGSSEDFISACRKGLLMGLCSVGTDAGNDFGQPGGPGHVVTGANTGRITYTVSSSDTFTGYGYVYYKVLR